MMENCIVPLSSSCPQNHRFSRRMVMMRISHIKHNTHSVSSWPESPVAHSPPLCCHHLVALFMVSWCPPWPLITTIITRAQPRRGLRRPLQQCITSSCVFFYHHIIIKHSGSVRNNKNWNLSLTSTAVMPGVVIMLSLLYLIDVPNKLNRDFQIETSDYEELPKVWSLQRPALT